MAILVLLCLPSAGMQAIAGEGLPRLPGEGVRIIDGDTLDVQLASGPARVRLRYRRARAQPARRTRGDAVPEAAGAGGASDAGVRHRRTVTSAWWPLSAWRGGEY